MTESDQLWSDHILRNVADVCFHLTWKGPNVCREKQNNPPVTSKMGSCLWCCCHWPEPEINRIQKGSKRVVPAWKIRFFFCWVDSFFLTLRLEVFFLFLFFCFSFFGIETFLVFVEVFFLMEVFLLRWIFKSKGGIFFCWRCWGGFYIEGVKYCSLRMLRGILHRRFFFHMRGCYMFYIETFYIVIIVWGEIIFCQGVIFVWLTFFFAEGWSFKLRGEYILLSQEGLLKSRVDICFLEVGFLYWGGGKQFLVWGNTSE